MGKKSVFEFFMESNDNILNFREKENISLQAYPRVFFMDSIFSFAPRGEVYFRDYNAYITDYLFFIEGLEIHTKLGVEMINDTERFGYLENDYVWSENQVNNMQQSNHVVGDNVFVLDSAIRKKDRPKVKVYKEQPISTVVQSAIFKDFDYESLTAKRKGKQMWHIGTTMGTADWNQFNMTTEDFLYYLSNYAYTEAHSNSPFYTFINANGEFYFMSLEEMLQQKSVATFELEIREDFAFNKKYIKDFTIMHGGIPINQPNYILRTYAVKEDGTYFGDTELQDNDIRTKGKAYKYNSATESFLIKRSDVLKQMPYSYFLDWDIYEGDDNYFSKGYINSLRRDTAISYRMELEVNFHPDLVAGKPIELKIKFGNKTENYAPQYEGKWLICKSEHLVDTDEFPMSKITISKPSIKIDKQHPAYADFI